MSDYPSRVENLRAMLRTSLPDDDFSIEEVWISHRTDAYGDEITARRFWRVTIQQGPEQIPTVVDVPDKLVIESLKTGVALVTKATHRIVRRKS